MERTAICVRFRVRHDRRSRNQLVGCAGSAARNRWRDGLRAHHDERVKRALPLTLLVVGVVMMVVAVVLGVRGIADAVSSTMQWTSSGPRQIVLTQGEWALYEEVVSPSPLARNVTADSVVVAGPSGSVPVTPAGVETLTVNNRTFVTVGHFTVPTDGTYEITVEPAGSAVMVGRPIAATALRTVAYFGLLGLGGLLAFAGIVWLIVAFIVSRSNRRQPLPADAAGMPQQGMAQPGMAQPGMTQPGVAQPGMTAPPVGGPGQWYPDPEDPTQWRWWDGRTWTDQRAPRQ